MGLFDGASKKDTEQQVLQRMMESSLVEYITDQIRNNPNAKWMLKGKHRDKGWRRVTVLPGGFIIEVPGAYAKRDKDNFVAYNFEDLGFAPITEHRNSRGKADISLSRMCYLYALALQEKMKPVMPNCKFQKVSNNRDMSKVSTENLLFALGDMLILNAGVRAEFYYQAPISSAELF